MPSEREFWKGYYDEKQVVGRSDDFQVNVSRTRDGQVINEDEWRNTLSYITKILHITKHSNIAELCCGNGVIIGELAQQSKTALGVDFSEELLSQLRLRYSSDNLTIVKSDINDITLANATFDAILIYFSIQHFDQRETILLIAKCIDSLKAGGRLLIGDIPDNEKKWAYINRPEYKKDYITRIIENRPKIGTWFEKDFFEALNTYFDNATIKVLNQPDYQINSDYRFDVLIEKQS